MNLMAAPRSAPWRMLLGHLAGGMADLVFPPACQLCDEITVPILHGFCHACQRALAEDPHEACPRCGGTVGPHGYLPTGCARCRDHSFAFDKVIRLGPHDGRLRDAILRMKHASGEELAETLGRLWVTQLKPALTAEHLDVVVPVPLHWWRRLQRGYNQAAALARELALGLAMPCEPDWLRRVRHTQHQMGQPATVRRANLHGAFVARPRPHHRGKSILLVDDVMTTGSTCHEAARTLRTAGASRIVVAILARSELHGIR